MSQILSPLDPTLTSRIKHYLNGAWYDTSLQSVLTLFNDSNTSSFVTPMESQYASPLTGASVQVRDDTESVHLVITPAGTIAALTLVFPIASGSSPNATDKQEVLFNTSQTITALTLDGNGATIRGAVTTLSADGFARYKYDAINSIWNRIG